MTRRSERGKTKSTPSEESPEKTVRKSVRTRRRRKSSSSSEEPSQSLKTEPEKNISLPLAVEVQDIQLPEESEPPNPPKECPTSTEKEAPGVSDVTQKDWKEDDKFWGNEDPKPDQEQSSILENAKEKEENSLWKVQSANGAGGGGEIQKLKICRQRPSESPELGETASRKRSTPGPKDGRSTDDSAHEESEKDTRKLKHRTRTSSRNSPMLSPTVVCDMSEGSPTKIKIINVSLISKGQKTEDSELSKEDESIDDKVQNQNSVEDIALPVDTIPQKSSEERSDEVLEVKLSDTQSDIIALDSSSINIEESIEDKMEPVELPKEENKPVEITTEGVSKNISPKRSSSESSSPKKLDDKSPSKSSRSDTDSSDDESKAGSVKKKRRRELQSAVQRKEESSNSEDEEKKMEAERRDSSETMDTQTIPNGQESKEEAIERSKDDNVDVAPKEEQTKCPMPRKRRWGSSKSNRSTNSQPVLSISTISLKSLIPDAKPIPAEELQLSVEEEEEGQLDDDEDEDEVIVHVAKEEEKQLERERQKLEKQKEKEKELEDKRKRQERFEKNKPEQPPAESIDTGAAQRKILLISDDAKKLARSPSPPRRKPTSVLFITHLVRPFTVQQLKNLLLRTGTIAENGFWIDKIKSKCYVEYTTEDAAVETRHALHGVRWPTSNPKTLCVEFASHEDLTMAQTLSEEPDVPRKAEPLNMVEGWVADQARIKERTRRPVVREWDVGKPENPEEALEFEVKAKEKRDQDRKTRKDRHHRSRTPETEAPARKARKKEEDAPAKLLDDLFRKTKTSPCIYWLPLSQEQIAVKEEIRRQHMAEHERRMAELKKADIARRDRERRTRK